MIRDSSMALSEVIDNQIEEIERLRAENKLLREVEQEAHDLMCWTHQYAIDCEPGDYSRNIKDLHPGIWNKLNSSEQGLYHALRQMNEFRDNT